MLRHVKRDSTVGVARNGGLPSASLAKHATAIFNLAAPW